MNDDKTVTQRLDIIINMLGENANSFSGKIGVTRSTIAGAISRNKGVNTDLLQKITDVFPAINIDWIVTGKGNKFKDSSTELQIVESAKSGVPYYENIDVAGGITSTFSDNKEIPSFYINYEHFNDCTAYMPVVGDSMYPKYASGEIIAVKQIFNLDVVQWGEAYLVITNGNANDLRTIKLLHPHDDESKIILRASNPNYKGDTVINKEDILSLFLIKGKITRNQL